MQFDFHKEHILEDDRVLLRPLQATDYDALLTYSINEPEIWHFNAGGPTNAENLRKYMDHALKQRERELEYPFIVFDKKGKLYAGSTRYYDIQQPRDTIQLGFTWYGKAFQATGLNKHCKYLLLQFAFEQLQARRVGFAANSKNERSIHAMKSIGCTVEGVLRSNGYDGDGNRVDSILLSMLKEEWENSVKENLGKRLA
jgi:RimJ/RimL family protein N-acetyltransferase